LTVAACRKPPGVFCTGRTTDRKAVVEVGDMIVDASTAWRISLPIPFFASWCLCATRENGLTQSRKEPRGKPRNPILHFGTPSQAFGTCAEPICKPAEAFWTCAEAFCKPAEAFCKSAKPFCKSAEAFCKSAKPFCKSAKPICKSAEAVCKSAKALCACVMRICKWFNRSNLNKEMHYA